MQLSVACIHVIVVSYPHPMCCCIYTALVSLLFGTVITTSFNILMGMFYTCSYMVYLMCHLYIGYESSDISYGQASLMYYINHAQQV